MCQIARLGLSLLNSDHHGLSTLVCMASCESTDKQYVHTPCPNARCQCTSCLITPTLLAGLAAQSVLVVAVKCRQLGVGACKAQDIGRLQTHFGCIR